MANEGKHRHARHEYSRWSTRGGVLAVAVSTGDGGDCFGPNGGPTNDTDLVTARSVSDEAVPIWSSGDCFGPDDGPRNDKFGCHSTLSGGVCRG
jgi:hypothetical protein